MLQSGNIQTEKTTKYKEKYQQFNINPNKGVPYYYRDNIIIFNLAACFIKKNNFVKFISNLKEAVEYGDSINFTNLASLCYKWDILYGDEECLNFVRTIHDLMKRDYPHIKLIQNEIYNLGEIDMRPIDSVIDWDLENNNIYVNNVLIECLKYLGFVGSQVYTILKTTTDFNKLIPVDLIQKLPITDSRTLESYEKIKEIILS